MVICRVTDISGQRFLQCFKSVFYDTGCHRPFLVPIPVMDVVTRVPRLNDLYVNYWVQQ